MIQIIINPLVLPPSEKVIGPKYTGFQDALNIFSSPLCRSHEKINVVRNKTNIVLTFLITLCINETGFQKYK